MNLRKNRTHLTGSSNLATRAETVRPATTHPYQTRPATTGVNTKRSTADEVIEYRTQRAVVTPFEKTRSFYNESGKTERPKTKIGEPRKLQLEDPDKMKMPFTGESELLFDRNLGKYRDPDSPAHKGRRKTINNEREQLAKEKHEEHSKAIQETQLVGYDKYSLDTLKNNVNLEKVREAKRIIRRKYGNRKNLHSIFVAWDFDRTGQITVDNLYVMAKRLGLNLNYDESRVLIATADNNGSGTLGLDEFFDLINNNVDVINVDLSKLTQNMGSDYTIRKEKLEGEDNNVIRRLEEDAKRTREVKHLNQVNMILKNKLLEISANFLKSDYTNKGYTTYDVFENNIKKLGIDEKLISTKDIRALFDKYKTDEHTLSYKNFIDGLKGFRLILEDIYQEQSHQPDLGALAKSKQIEEQQVDEKDVHIVDFRNLPYSTAYQFLAKKRKVSRLIQKFFPKQEDLREYIAKTLKQGQGADMEYLTKRETKDSMMGLFKKFDVSNLTARDFEGFLSSFVYNKQGLTKVDDVLTAIYEQDEDDFIKNINERKKGPPPTGLDAYEKEDLARRKSETLSTHAYDEKQNKKKLNELLRIVDDRLFTNRIKHYDLYKQFDVDGDGFVSRKDFITKARQMSLVPNEDINTLVNYLDPENKGYVNFREFNNKIRTHATDQDERLKPIVPNSTLPSKENWQKVADTLPDTQAKVTELYEKYRPDNYKTLRPTSRFGEAPSWKNTFTQMQAPINSPMFISERERFLRTPESRVLPTLEDNEKRRRIASARVDVIRQRMDTLQARVEADTQKQDNLEQSRMRTKLASAIAHEQGAKVRNYK